MSRTRTFCRRGRTVLAAGLIVVLTSGLAALSRGADRAKSAAKRPAKSQAEMVELFAAVKKGDIEVKLIPTNDKEANVVITNKTKRPLSVRLPEAFAGVPVLAQAGVGFNDAGVGAGRGNNNNNNQQNQALGGGFGGGGGLGGGLGGGGLGGGGFGGAFNIAPEKVGKLKVACVCLEHGKKDPNPRVPYTMKPIDQYTKDLKVQVVLQLLSSGKINQRIAQAAAWHFANGMSWQQLASKKIDRIGRPDEPYFRPAELRAALQVAALTERVAKQQETSSESSNSARTFSQR
jgi:hypothetical protein